MSDWDVGRRLNAISAADGDSEEKGDDYFNEEEGDQGALVGVQSQVA